MRAQIYPAVMLTILLTILTGLFYPLTITALAQVLFPHQANGSLIVEGGRVLGADLGEARRRGYAAFDNIDWPQGFCRRDIGRAKPEKQ